MKSLVPIILIIATVGLFFFEVKPFYSEVQMLRTEGMEYDHALEMAAELGALRSKLETKLESFSQADLNRLNHFLPQQLDTVRIIFDIDGIGVRNGLKVSNIKASAEAASPKIDPEKIQGRTATAAGPTYQTVNVSFDFKAPYSQGVSFIRDLEKSLRLIDSVKVDITPPEPQSSLYTFKMEVRTHWINR